VKLARIFADNAGKETASRPNCFAARQDIRVVHVFPHELNRLYMRRMLRRQVTDSIIAAKVRLSFFFHTAVRTFDVKPVVWQCPSALNRTFR
jgi:hypothetical protein